MQLRSRFGTRGPMLIGLAVAIAGLTGAVGGRLSIPDRAAVSGTAAANISLTETFATNLSAVNARVTPAIAFSQSYVPGTGNGAIDKKWCDRRTIAASGADTLDLAGVLTNEFGSAVTFVTVKALVVKADAGNTNDVWLGGAATNRFGAFLKDSSVIVVKPGYMQLIAGGGAGYAVTAATGDKLLAKNSSSGTGVTYEICIAGTSA